MKNTITNNVKKHMRNFTHMLFNNTIRRNTFKNADNFKR